MCLDVDKCTTLADIQFIHIYKGHKLKRNSSLANHRRRPRFKTTTKGHRHSDQHSNSEAILENILRDGVSMLRSSKIIIVGLHLKGRERALGNQTIFETVSKATLGKLPTDEAAESIIMGFPTA